MNNRHELLSLVDPEEPMKCLICGYNLHCRWTDTHGIGACLLCGTPYRIYHYEGNPKKRVDKPPKSLLNEEYVELTKRYWQETPGYGNFQGSSYEVATQEDVDACELWWSKQESLDTAKGDEE